MTKEYMLYQKFMSKQFNVLEKRMVKELQQHKMLHTMYAGMSLVHNPTYVIMDEATDIHSFNSTIISYVEPREKDWERTLFTQDNLSSTPSASKRAKLRAKRKKNR